MQVMKNLRQITAVVLSVTLLWEAGNPVAWAHGVAPRPSGLGAPVEFAAQALTGYLAAARFQQPVGTPEGVARVQSRISERTNEGGLTRRGFLGLIASIPFLRTLRGQSARALGDGTLQSAFESWARRSPALLSAYYRVQSLSRSAVALNQNNQFVDFHMTDAVRAPAVPLVPNKLDPINPAQITARNDLRTEGKRSPWEFDGKIDGNVFERVFGLLRTLYTRGGFTRNSQSVVDESVAPYLEALHQTAIADIARDQIVVDHRLELLEAYGQRARAAQAVETAQFQAAAQKKRVLQEQQLMELFPTVERPARIAAMNVELTSLSRAVKQAESALKAAEDKFDALAMDASEVRMPEIEAAFDGPAGVNTALQLEGETWAFDRAYFTRLDALTHGSLGNQNPLSFDRRRQLVDFAWSVQQPPSDFLVKESRFKRDSTIRPDLKTMREAARTPADEWVKRAFERAMPPQVHALDETVRSMDTIRRNLNDSARSKTILRVFGRFSLSAPVQFWFERKDPVSREKLALQLDAADNQEQAYRSDREEVRRRHADAVKAAHGRLVAVYAELASAAQAVAHNLNAVSPLLAQVRDPLTGVNRPAGDFSEPAVQLELSVRTYERTLLEAVLAYQKLSLLTDTPAEHFRFARYVTEERAQASRSASPATTPPTKEELEKYRLPPVEPFNPKKGKAETKQSNRGFASLGLLATVLPIAAGLPVAANLFAAASPALERPPLYVVGTVVRIYQWMSLVYASQPPAIWALVAIGLLALGIPHWLRNHFTNGETRHRPHEPLLVQHRYALRQGVFLLVVFTLFALIAGSAGWTAGVSVGTAATVTGLSMLSMPGRLGRTPIDNAGWRALDAWRFQLSRRQWVSGGLAGAGFFLMASFVWSGVEKPLHRLADFYLRNMGHSGLSERRAGTHWVRMPISYTAPPDETGVVVAVAKPIQSQVATPYLVAWRSTADPALRRRMQALEKQTGIRLPDLPDNTAQAFVAIETNGANGVDKEISDLLTELETSVTHLRTAQGEGVSGTQTINERLVRTDQQITMGRLRAAIARRALRDQKLDRGFTLDKTDVGVRTRVDAGKTMTIATQQTSILSIDLPMTPDEAYTLGFLRGLNTPESLAGHGIEFTLPGLSTVIIPASHLKRLTAVPVDADRLTNPRTGAFPTMRYAAYVEIPKDLASRLSPIGGNAPVLQFTRFVRRDSSGEWMPFLERLPQGTGIANLTARPDSVVGTVGSVAEGLYTGPLTALKEARAAAKAALDDTARALTALPTGSGMRETTVLRELFKEIEIKLRKIEADIDDLQSRQENALKIGVSAPRSGPVVTREGNTLVAWSPLARKWSVTTPGFPTSVPSTLPNPGIDSSHDPDLAVQFPYRPTFAVAAYLPSADTLGAVSGATVQIPGQTLESAPLILKRAERTITEDRDPIFGAPRAILEFRNRPPADIQIFNGDPISVLPVALRIPGTTPNERPRTSPPGTDNPLFGSLRTMSNREAVQLAPVLLEYLTYIGFMVFALVHGKDRAVKYFTERRERKSRNPIRSRPEDRPVPPRFAFTAVPNAISDDVISRVANYAENRFFSYQITRQDGSRKSTAELMMDRFGDEGLRRTDAVRFVQHVLRTRNLSDANDKNVQVRGILTLLLLTLFLILHFPILGVLSQAFITGVATLPPLLTPLGSITFDTPLPQTLASLALLYFVIVILYGFISSPIKNWSEMTLATRFNLYGVLYSRFYGIHRARERFRQMTVHEPGQDGTGLDPYEEVLRLLINLPARGPEEAKKVLLDHTSFENDLRAFSEPLMHRAALVLTQSARSYVQTGTHKPEASAARLWATQLKESVARQKGPRSLLPHEEPWEQFAHAIDMPSDAMLDAIADRDLGLDVRRAGNGTLAEYRDRALVHWSLGIMKQHPQFCLFVLLSLDMTDVIFEAVDVRDPAQSALFAQIVEPNLRSRIDKTLKSLQTNLRTLAPNTATLWREHHRYNQQNQLIFAVDRLFNRSPENGFQIGNEQYKRLYQLMSGVVRQHTGEGAPSFEAIAFDFYVSTDRDALSMYAAPASAFMDAYERHRENPAAYPLPVYPDLLTQFESDPSTSDPAYVRLLKELRRFYRKEGLADAEVRVVLARVIRDINLPSTQLFLAYAIARRLDKTDQEAANQLGKELDTSFGLRDLPMTTLMAQRAPLYDEAREMKTTVGDVLIENRLGHNEIEELREAFNADFNSDGEDDAAFDRFILGNLIIRVDAALEKNLQQAFLRHLSLLPSTSARVDFLSMNREVDEFSNDLNRRVEDRLPAKLSTRIRAWLSHQTDVLLRHLSEAGPNLLAVSMEPANVRRALDPDLTDPNTWLLIPPNPFLVNTGLVLFYWRHFEKIHPRRWEKMTETVKANFERERTQKLMEIETRLERMGIRVRYVETEWDPQVLTKWTPDQTRANSVNSIILIAPKVRQAPVATQPANAPQVPAHSFQMDATTFEPGETAIGSNDDFMSELRTFLGKIWWGRGGKGAIYRIINGVAHWPRHLAHGYVYWRYQGQLAGVRAYFVSRLNWFGRPTQAVYTSYMAVARRFKGQRLGLAFVKESLVKLESLYRQARLFVAYIDADNEPSKRNLIDSGYRLISVIHALGITSDDPQPLANVKRHGQIDTRSKLFTFLRDRAGSDLLSDIVDESEFSRQGYYAVEDAHGEIIAAINVKPMTWEFRQLKNWIPPFLHRISRIRGLPFHKRLNLEKMKMVKVSHLTWKDGHAEDALALVNHVMHEQEVHTAMIYVDKTSAMYKELKNVGAFGSLRDIPGWLASNLPETAIEIYARARTGDTEIARQIDLLNGRFQNTQAVAPTSTATDEEAAHMVRPVEPGSYRLGWLAPLIGGAAAAAMAAFSAPVAQAAQPLTALTMPARAVGSATETLFTPMVRAGDSPWSIAERLWGDGSRWRDVLTLNPQFGTPDHFMMHPGQWVNTGASLSPAPIGGLPSLPGLEVQPLDFLQQLYVSMPDAVWFGLALLGLGALIVLLRHLASPQRVFPTVASQPAKHDAWLAPFPGLLKPARVALLLIASVLAPLLSLATVFSPAPASRPTIIASRSLDSVQDPVQSRRVQELLDYAGQRLDWAMDRQGADATLVDRAKAHRALHETLVATQEAARLKGHSDDQTPLASALEAAKRSVPSKKWRLRVRRFGRALAGAGRTIAKPFTAKEARNPSSGLTLEQEMLKLDIQRLIAEAKQRLELAEQEVAISVSGSDENAKGRANKALAQARADIDELQNVYLAPDSDGWELASFTKTYAVERWLKQPTTNRADVEQKAEALHKRFAARDPRRGEQHWQTLGDFLYRPSPAINEEVAWKLDILSNLSAMARDAGLTQTAQDYMTESIELARAAGLPLPVRGQPEWPSITYQTVDPSQVSDLGTEQGRLEQSVSTLQTTAQRAHALWQQYKKGDTSSEPDLRTGMDSLARAHLEFLQARKAFTKAADAYQAAKGNVSFETHVAYLAVTAPVQTADGAADGDDLASLPVRTTLSFDRRAVPPPPLGIRGLQDWDTPHLEVPNKTGRRAPVPTETRRKPQSRTVARETPKRVVTVLPISAPISVPKLTPPPTPVRAQERLVKNFNRAVSHPKPAPLPQVRTRKKPAVPLIATQPVSQPAHETAPAQAAQGFVPAAQPASAEPTDSGYYESRPSWDGAQRTSPKPAGHKDATAGSYLAFREIYSWSNILILTIFKIFGLVFFTPILYKNRRPVIKLVRFVASTFAREPRRTRSRRTAA